MFGMRRREFITLLGGAVAGWPLAARTEQGGRRLVGVRRRASHSDQFAALGVFATGGRLAGHRLPSLPANIICVIESLGPE
jgi:hypothetical protein